VGIEDSQLEVVEMRILGRPGTGACEREHQRNAAYGWRLGAADPDPVGERLGHEGEATAGTGDLRTEEKPTAFQVWRNDDIG
jgi:hypothetical protein